MTLAKPPLLRGYLDSHLGRINLLIDPEGALKRLDFSLPDRVEARPEYRDVPLDQEATADIRQQLSEYLLGTRREFDVVLAPTGSAFLKEAWALLRAIPYATTTTYGDLARAMTKPSSARAIGMANAVNPISIIVPCHRVIAATGQLTGYSGGLDKKRGLLLLEARFAGADKDDLFHNQQDDCNRL